MPYLLNLKDDAYSHISSEERKPVLEAIINNRKWLEDVVSKVQSVNRAEEPPAKCSDIANTQSNFVNVIECPLC
jgi:hypothetical protein